MGFKITTRNFAMFGVLAVFALFGRSWGVEMSLGSESTFEADCTIIDTVKKLSSRLWLSSETLNEQRLEVALAKARKKNRKLKTTKRANEQKRLVNASHFSFPENETSAIQQEVHIHRTGGRGRPWPRAQHQHSSFRSRQGWGQRRCARSQWAHQGCG